MTLAKGFKLNLSKGSNMAFSHGVDGPKSVQTVYIHSIGLPKKLLKFMNSGSGPWHMPCLCSHEGGGQWNCFWCESQPEPRPCLSFKGGVTLRVVTWGGGLRGHMRFLNCWPAKFKQLLSNHTGTNGSWGEVAVHPSLHAFSSRCPFEMCQHVGWGPALVNLLWPFGRGNHAYTQGDPTPQLPKPSDS